MQKLYHSLEILSIIRGVNLVTAKSSKKSIDIARRYGKLLLETTVILVIVI